jgi:5,10-methylenetetrahydromethanopterin reductase
MSNVIETTAHCAQTFRAVMYSIGMFEERDVSLIVSALGGCARSAFEVIDGLQVGGVMEIGIILFPPLGKTAQTAQMVERLGLASMVFPDSQNLAPEVWGQLMLAAAATSKLQLGPGVTNSVTRDAAVTASAALSLQVESGGRAVLAIGRGDSSVQRIGKHEDPVASFERYLQMVQGYLSGEVVDRDGFESRLEWMRYTKVPKVPVEVAATGRRVIEAAARRADRICFAVGADPDHLTEVLDHARSAARAAGRDPSALRYGAFVNAVIHPDVEVGRKGVRGTAATFARFSAFKGSKLENLPAPLRDAARHLRVHYDMREHTRAGAAHTAGLSDEFVDWFAIVGPPERALPRFRQLADIGLDFLRVVPGSLDMPRDVAAASLINLANAIVPAFRK